MLTLAFVDCNMNNSALQRVQYERIIATWQVGHCAIFVIALSPSQPRLESSMRSKNLKMSGNNFHNPSCCEVKEFDVFGQTVSQLSMMDGRVSTFSGLYTRTDEEIFAVYPRLTAIPGLPSMNNCWLSNVNIHLLLPLEPCASYILHCSSP